MVSFSDYDLKPFAPLEESKELNTYLVLKEDSAK